MAHSDMTCDQAVAVATRFASEHHLPIGKLADARHTPAAEYTRWGLDRGHGGWLVMFHYVGPLTPTHPKVTLRMDVGWLLCVLVNDVTGEAELWQDYRDEQRGFGPRDEPTG
jgi:hypothetical protein